MARTKSYRFPAPISGGYFHLKVRKVTPEAVYLQYSEGGIGEDIKVLADGVTVKSVRSPGSFVPNYVRGRAVEVADVVRGASSIQSNPSTLLPRNKWINAKVRVTKDGKVQAIIGGRHR